MANISPFDIALTAAREAFDCAVRDKKIPTGTKFAYRREESGNDDLPEQLVVIDHVGRAFADIAPILFRGTICDVPPVGVAATHV